jgi:hypothetical protein
MIRQNLLMLAIALITVTGCATTMSQNCGSHCSAGKHCRHQHRCHGARRCHCNQAGPLYPGDTWGQPMGAYPMADQWVMDPGSGGCCDTGMMDGGCSSCGSDMSAMMMPAQGGAGCNCGGQHSAGMEMAPMMSPQPQAQPFMNGTPAPLPPAVFEAPKSDPAEQNLPPVPNDAAPMNGAPAAGPVVDPVSWETPVFFPSNHTQQQSNVPLRRAQPVQVR